MKDSKTTPDSKVQDWGPGPDWERAAGKAIAEEIDRQILTQLLRDVENNDQFPRSTNESYVTFIEFEDTFRKTKSKFDDGVSAEFGYRTPDQLRDNVLSRLERDNEASGAYVEFHKIEQVLQDQKTSRLVKGANMGIEVWLQLLEKAQLLK